MSEPERFAKQRRAAQANGDAPPLPHSLQAERAVLSCIFLDNDAMTGVAAILTPYDFFLPNNVHVFGCMQEMAVAKMPIDLITICEQLQRRGDLETAGGAPYLASLIDSLFQGANVEDYARIVKEKSLYRKVIHAAHKIQEHAFRQESSPADIACEAAGLMKDIEALVPAENIPVYSAKEFCERKLKVRTYLLEGYLRDNTMSELYAWRGLGKTMLQIAECHAIATGGVFLKWKAPKPRKVLLVDGELNGRELQDRLKLLGADQDENLYLLACDDLDEPFPHLSTPRAQGIIEDKLAKTGAEYLELDNLSALGPGSDEEEVDLWIPTQKWLLGLRRQGISNRFLHHAGYNGHARGTSRREDLLDLVIELRKPKDYTADQGLRVELHFQKTRGYMGHDAEPLLLQFRKNFDGKWGWEFEALEDTRVKEIAKLRADGTGWREIEKVTGIPKSTAQRIFEEFETNKHK